MATKTPDTVDIISDLVDQLTPMFAIDSATTNADGTYTLETLNTYWLRPEKVITIDGKDYRIVSFVINESITIKEIVTGSGVPTVTAFSIPKPNFYHGTPMMAGQEQGRVKSAAGKTPFIWLYEVFNETVIDDRRSPYGRSSTPRLFFMDEAKNKDWTSAQHKTNAIEPIRQMSELLQATIRSQRDMFDEVKERTEIARANWGTFVTDKGNTSRFFNQDLSGIESTFDLVMTKKACDNRIGGLSCNIGVTVSTTDETGAGAADGTATANISGLQGEASYLWTTEDGSIPAGEETKQTATGLIAGTYTVLVSDSVLENCSAMNSGDVNALATANPDDLDNLTIWIRPDIQTLFNGGSVSDLDPVSDADSQAPATVDFLEAVAADQATWHQASGGDLEYIRYNKTQGTRLNSTYGQAAGFTTIDVIEMVTLSADNNIWDNEGGGGTNYRLQINADGEIKLSSSDQIVTGVLHYISAGQKVVITCVVNASGTDSKLRINNEDWIEGDLATKAINNFTYGSKANNANSESGDFKQFESVLYSDVKTDEEIDPVKNGLMLKHGI